MKCTRCSSFAINPHCHDRDDTRMDLCDVCWWMNKAEKIEIAGDKLAARHLSGHPQSSKRQQHVREYHREKEQL